MDCGLSVVVDCGLWVKGCGLWVVVVVVVAFSETQNPSSCICMEEVMHWYEHVLYHAIYRV